MRKKPIVQQPVQNIQPQLSTLNINKFSFVQLFNDSNGKTSASATAGLLIILFSCLGFGFSIGMKYNEGITGASIFVGSGALLLGANRMSKDKDISEQVSGNVVVPVVTAEEK